MKKIILLILISFTFFTSNLFGQTKEGDVFVDVYYGFPDWYKYYMKSDYSYHSNNNVKISSTGYVGGRAEYMVAKRIGFGLDLWYVKASASGSYSENIYDYSNTSTNGYSKDYVINVNHIQVRESLARITCLGRVIVHMGQSKKIDPYVHIGFGYVSYKHNYSSSGNNSNGQDNEDFFPLGARAGFGMRVFFTEKFGANIDLGLGGALFTTGLTYKFLSKTE